MHLNMSCCFSSQEQSKLHSATMSIYGIYPTTRVNSAWEEQLDIKMEY
jgi:hypothetical protein